MSLALYLRSFFGSDKIRQLTALKSGGSATLELLRESGKFLIIGGSDNYMLTDILYFYTAAVVVLSAALGIMLFRFVSSRAKNNIYFSLGISRAGLFSAHWLAGAVMLEAGRASPARLFGNAEPYILRLVRDALAHAAVLRRSHDRDGACGILCCGGSLRLRGNRRRIGTVLARIHSVSERCCIFSQ